MMPLSALPLHSTLATGSPAAHARARPKIVLLVDDDSALREIVRITLEGLDCQCLESADGRGGLALARASRPDLLLLDWMLPEMTGIELAETLRSDPATATIPIVMLTTRAEPEAVARGQRAGIQAYLIKPFSPLELLQTVEEALG